MIYIYRQIRCNKAYDGLCRRAADIADQNREQYLQIDAKMKNEHKNTPVLPNPLETQGFCPFWAGYPNKKRDSLTTVSCGARGGT